MSFAIRPDQPNAGAVFNTGRVAPLCMIGNVTRMDATATSACCNAWGHGIRSLTDGRASLVLSSSSLWWGFVARVRSLRRGRLFLREPS